jgi:hypothetical protein
VFYARRQVKGRRNSGLQSSGQNAVAVAVRERGTEKFSNILRFVHSLPEPINLLTNTWIASPRKEIYANFLFGSWMKRIFPPQWPAETDMSAKCRVARQVSGAARS